MADDAVIDQRLAEARAIDTPGSGSTSCSISSSSGWRAPPRPRPWGELGYRVKSFTYHDAARRAHSIAAQDGINAAKNYHGDGDSVHRLFYDTIKGGDYRSREANVHRLAEVSNNIIDQCVAQGVPFAREVRRAARQPVLRRRPGLAHLPSPRTDRPAAAARRLPGPVAAVKAGTVELHTNQEMLELVVVDGKAVGIDTHPARLICRSQRELPSGPLLAAPYLRGCAPLGGLAPATASAGVPHPGRRTRTEVARHRPPSTQGVDVYEVYTQTDSTVATSPEEHHNAIAFDRALFSTPISGQGIS